MSFSSQGAGWCAAVGPAVRDCNDSASQLWTVAYLLGAYLTTSGLAACPLRRLHHTICFLTGYPCNSMPQSSLTLKVPVTPCIPHLPSSARAGTAALTAQSQSPLLGFFVSLRQACMHHKQDKPVSMTTACAFSKPRFLSNCTQRPMPYDGAQTLKANVELQVVPNTGCKLRTNRY